MERKKIKMEKLRYQRKLIGDKKTAAAGDGGTEKEEERNENGRKEARKGNKSRYIVFSL